MPTALFATLYVLLLLVLMVLVSWEYRRHKFTDRTPSRLVTEPPVEIEPVRGFVRPRARPAPEGRYH